MFRNVMFMLLGGVLTFSSLIGVAYYRDKGNMLPVFTSETVAICNSEDECRALGFEICQANKKSISMIVQKNYDGQVEIKCAYLD